MANPKITFIKFFNFYTSNEIALFILFVNTYKLKYNVYNKKVKARK